MFFDEATVTLISGKGGDGAASFHTEKHVPRGGPNGANGGRGGDVILVANRNKRTLYDFKLRDKFEAKPGTKAVSNKAGKDAKDIIIHVPVGTVVTDSETGKVLVDLSTDGMKFVACQGGRGGMGNLHFTTSVRQTPTFAQRGAPGETVVVELELKLVAEVGLIGLPNAGKSTLLSRLSAAKPKIGAYPFTTITPNLGVVEVAGETFVMSDLPGLIEGASQGVGLGHQFLRHAERNKVLLHLIDAFPIDESDPFANYEMIESELKLYSEDLYNRPRIIALNKIDMGNEEMLAEVKAKFTHLGVPIFTISGYVGTNLDDLKWALYKEIQKAEEAEIPTAVILAPEVKPGMDQSWDVEKTEHGYRVTGKRIERLVAMTDLDNRDAVHYLYRKLRRIGVIQKLEEMGADQGDSVEIGDEEFSYEEW
ncbi:MAG: GTPase ObgE [Armatimonadetes bacterium]|nr:GTPase ObgE [Armatimonadota bacterium]